MPRRAFTLVEVIVSLAIFALAAVALSAAYLNVLEGYRNRDRERARDDAWALVRIAALSETDRDALERGGTVELPGGQRMNWRATITSTELADLFAIELSAEAPPPDEWTHQSRVMTYRPNWSDPTERDRLRTESRNRWEAERAR
ncbi:MAG: prepilin-type N-terminal cleavage/methylation domain-containing protein [Cephaloticoccus sp.]